MPLMTGPAGLNQILSLAGERGASDIHLDPDAETYQIRFRIAGKLQFTDLSCDRTCIQALKVLAHIDLSDRRAPGDGHFTWKENDRGMEVRVSIIPTVAGPKFALRCLPLSDFAFELDRLGLPEEDLECIREILLLKEGLLLTAGRTNSGKTTTLYAILLYLLQRGLHIVSLENPVERRIPGITQIEIGGSSSISFADGIRAVLRQDPNVIMIGEIRDEITAQAAVQAALTGHLVLSSLHAADAYKAIVRLLELKTNPLFLSNTLLAVIAHEFSSRSRHDHPAFLLSKRNDLLPLFRQPTHFFPVEGDNRSSIIAEPFEPFGSSQIAGRPDERSSAFVRGWLDYK